MDGRVQEIISLFESDERYLKAQDPLGELSRSVNLSCSRVRHIFRAETGMSWGRFVKSVRIERAKNLLASSFLRVKEVCCRVGINDESQFVREFRQAVGLTPARYRSYAASRKLQESRSSSTARDANK
jgi:transcriptional regulator GlxA family with amidase domain